MQGASSTRLANLVSKDVALVKEQNHVGLLEPASVRAFQQRQCATQRDASSAPFGVASLVEELKSFQQTILRLVLKEHLVVLADSGDEDDCSHLLEAGNERTDQHRSM